jgi:aminoglycoside N3'-acetyltransferase
MKILKDPWLRRKDEPRERRMQVTKDEIILSLKRLGLHFGDIVFVHSSLSSFGYVLGGPDTIIDALLEIISCQGTLVFPTFTIPEWTEALLLGLSKTPENKNIKVRDIRNLMKGNVEKVDSALARGSISTSWIDRRIKELNLIEHKEEAEDCISYKVNLKRVRHLLKIKPNPWSGNFFYNKNTTPSCMGIISETFRLKKGVIRSDHPTKSIVSLGPKTKILTNQHGLPRNSWLPKLYECDAKYLLLGIDYRYCTIFHFLEHRFKELEKDYTHPSFDFLKIGKVLEKERIVHCQKIGEATCRIFKCKQMVDLALKIIRKNPEAFLR